MSMKLVIGLFALSLFAADKIAISKEDQLKIAIFNGRLINSRFELANKQAIRKFIEDQVKEAETQLTRVEQEGQAILKKLLESYKLKDVSCSFFNEQAELVCTPVPPAKKGK